MKSHKMVKIINLKGIVREVMDRITCFNFEIIFILEYSLGVEINYYFSSSRCGRGSYRHALLFKYTLK